MSLVFSVTDNLGRKKVVNDKKSQAKPVEKRFSNHSNDAKEEKEDSQFTKEEVKSLKALIERLDDLLALVPDKKDKDKKDKDKKDKDDKESDDEFEFEEELSTKDEDIVDLPDGDEGEGEEVEETSEEITEDGLVDVDDDLDEAKATRTHDSRKSFGAIESKKTTSTAVYSNEDMQEEINEAFKKRYGGRK